MKNKTKPLSYTYFLHLFVDSGKRCRQTQPKQSKSAAAFWPPGKQKICPKIPSEYVFAWVLICFNSPVLFWNIKIKKKRKKDLCHPPQKKKNGRRGKFNVFNPLALLLRARTDGCWYEHTRSSAKLMTARAATFIHCKAIRTNKACGRHHLGCAAETFPIDCMYLSSTCADCSKPGGKKGKTHWRSTGRNGCAHRAQAKTINWECARLFCCCFDLFFLKRKFSVTINGLQTYKLQIEL